MQHLASLVLKEIKFTYPVTSHLSVPAGSSLPALPGLRLAAVVPVSLSLPADRRLPVGLTRQHPPATLLQLPGQLPAREMQTLAGTRHLRASFAYSAGVPDWKRPHSFAVKCLDLNNDHAVLVICIVNPQTFKLHHYNIIICGNTLKGYCWICRYIDKVINMWYSTLVSLFVLCHEKKDLELKYWHWRQHKQEVYVLLFPEPRTVVHTSEWLERYAVSGLLLRSIGPSSASGVGLGPAVQQGQTWSFHPASPPSPTPPAAAQWQPQHQPGHTQGRAATHDATHPLVAMVGTTALTETDKTWDINVLAVFDLKWFISHWQVHLNSVHRQMSVWVFARNKQIDIHQ